MGVVFQKPRIETRAVRAFHGLLENSWSEIAVSDRRVATPSLVGYPLGATKLDRRERRREMCPSAHTRACGMRGVRRHCELDEGMWGGKEGKEAVEVDLLLFTVEHARLRKMR